MIHATPAEKDEDEFSEFDPCSGAGLNVASLVDGPLVELTLTTGSTLSSNLEFRGRAGDGDYPDDMVSTVRANTHELKFDEDALGFAEQ